MVGSSFVKQIYRNKKDYQGIIFLDRDGTINKEVSYLRDKAQIEILPQVAEGIALLNKEKIAVVVITNQPVVARGYVTTRGLKEINDILVEHLMKENAYIDAIYSCPHHPERYHPDIPVRAMKYRIECDCRKPKLAMLKKAAEDFNINLESAFIVGNTSHDIMTGKNLGIPTILVETGFGGKDNKYSVKPDYVTRDFSHAVDIIMRSIT